MADSSDKRKLRPSRWRSSYNGIPFGHVTGKVLHVDSGAHVGRW
jgi:hypothetical protein